MSSKQEVCESEPLNSIQEQVHSSVCYLKGTTVSGSLLHIPTNAAERGALGNSGVRLYMFLCGVESPMTANEIAVALVMERGQAYYRLCLLREYRLVELTKSGWHVIQKLTFEELDEFVARPRGKQGKAEARHEQFSDERARYATDIVLNYRRRDPDFPMRIHRCPQCRRKIWLLPRHPEHWCPECDYRWSPSYT